MLTLRSLRTLIHPPRLPRPTRRFLHSSRPTSSSKPPFSWSNPSARSCKPVSPLQNAPSGADNPLEQVRKALELPVPKVFPELLDKRLEKLLFSKPTAKEREGIDQEFVEAYHPRRLEFCGDKILGQVVVDTLFLLAPVQPLKVTGQKPSLTEMGNVTGRLVTNDFIATLSAEFKLEGSLPPDDMWEAALAALAFSNGRQALLNFFVPIVKRELFCQHPELQLKAKRETSPGPSSVEAELAAPLPSDPASPPPSLPLPVSLSSPSAVPKKPTPPSEVKVASVAHPGHAGVVLATKREKRALMQAKRPEPVIFRSAADAEQRLLPVLEQSQITFAFRHMHKMIQLRLSGYEPFSVTGTKKRPAKMAALVKLLEKKGAIRFELSTLKCTPTPPIFSEEVDLAMEKAVLGVPMDVVFAHLEGKELGTSKAEKK